MSRLSPEQYRSFLASESRRFREVLADCDPQARVPGCPEWDAADLLWHLTEVQDFWAWVITHRPDPPDAYAAPERPSAYRDALAAFDDRSAALQSALAGADPADAAWSWCEDHTVAFTLRRQALEALVHRVDAEQAVGRTSPLDTGLAADGVEEVLDVMYGGTPEWGGSPAPTPATGRTTTRTTSAWFRSPAPSRTRSSAGMRRPC